VRDDWIELSDGVRLFAEPVREIDGLHGKKHAWADRVRREERAFFDRYAPAAREILDALLKVLRGA